MILTGKSIFVSALLLGVSRRAATMSASMSVETCQSNQTSQTMSHYSIVYVTTPTEEVARMLARELVFGKLAACANIVPKVISIYEWENKIQEDSEALMMLKTRTSKLDQLTAYVKAKHPYKVCEVIAVPITGGNDMYFKWMEGVIPEK
ncbi:divalent-cation tolerance protein CutA isoform X1 [Euwallacea similis]|uniref:divalent-cation tolerance protein CutA isoform X1 n=2 Tax=Euwallacea similis TaxID=1736056 RepID=UPI00344BCC83